MGQNGVGVSVRCVNCYGQGCRSTQLGPQIQWVHSYVTGDQIYCVYRAPNKEMVLEHARQGGFPANRVSEIKTTIDPTAE